MFVSEINDVKIYNLSAGKSLPEWLSDQKRKTLLKKNVDLRRRIVLIQDFEMPAVSTAIRISSDGQHILATGTYKPRVKCYDVNQLSLKFERCFDSEPVTFEILSEDYSKLVFLHCDRYVEFHAAHGRHFRLRIPKFGRDMAYHGSTSDLLVVGQGSEIFRLNLERGQFLQPYNTEASCLNSVEVNAEHHLICVGTQESTVEAWDSRTRERCGILDVAMKLQYKEFPAITTMKFRDGLQLAVGTQSGHVVLYDLRSSQPLLIKDHLNRLPIKKIDFNREHNVVYSMDASMLKIFDEASGKQKAYIESTSNFNDFATVPGSGMFFFAQEDIKLLSYYIPSLGPAPRWCSMLDNITEEFESESVQNIYDDYKFVTRPELEELELDHLEGTNLLKGYMHGFFIDMRLYNKAKAAADPFAYERYKREKIRAQIEATRPSRLQIKSKAVKVNKDLAENETLRQDDRFKALFDNPEFSVDKSADQYRLLAPVLSHLSKPKHTPKTEEITQEPDDSTDDELFYGNKDEESSASSEDEAKPWVEDVKKEYKKIQREKAQDDIEMYEIDEFKSSQGRSRYKSIGTRLAKLSTSDKVKHVGGNRSITFSTEKITRQDKKRLAEMRKHREERRKVIRSTKPLGLKRPFPK